MSVDEDEAIAFLRGLMPQGFAGPDVLAELVPDGWEESPYVEFFHPELGVPFPESDPELKDRPRTAVDPDRECRDLVGRIVWEVLAEDHSVIAPDGRRIDLGEYDDASSVLHLFDQGEIDEEPGVEDWLDMWDRGNSTRFSCDLSGIEREVDCSDVYELVFRRMQALDIDWIYEFPKCGLYRFEQPRASEAEDPHSPVDNFLKELEHQEALKESEEKQAKLDAINQEAAEKAAKEAPPVIVQAYMNVFGRRPSGWPPA